MALAQQVADRANHLVLYAQTRDIGYALVGVVKKLAGVPLRDRGGFYLLPPSKCGTWAALKPELEKIGMRPIRIEMHDAPDNVQAASGAAKSALEEDVKELMGELEKAATDGIKEYKIERRVEKCRALSAKAELFRGVLQSTVDEIQRRTEAMAEAFQKLAAKDDEASFAAPPVVD